MKSMSQKNLGTGKKDNNIPGELPSPGEMEMPELELPDLDLDDLFTVTCPECGHKFKGW